MSGRDSQPRSERIQQQFYSSSTWDKHSNIQFMQMMHIFISSLVGRFVYGTTWINNVGCGPAHTIWHTSVFVDSFCRAPIVIKYINQSAPFVCVHFGFICKWNYVSVQFTIRAPVHENRHLQLASIWLPIYFRNFNKKKNNENGLFSRHHCTSIEMKTHRFTDLSSTDRMIGPLMSSTILATLFRQALGEAFVCVCVCVCREANNWFTW